MNVEVENCVRVFIKANVRRIQIALAFAIIRSKPPGLTAVEYAANIQAQVKLKYSNTEVSESECSNSSISYNHKVLFLQQKHLLTRLWGILPESCSMDPTVSDSLKLLTGYSYDMFESEDKLQSCVIIDNTDNDATLMKRHEFNLEFIQAMIQLKNVIGASAHVSVSKLQDVFSELSAPQDSANSGTQSYSSEYFISTLSSLSTPYSEARLTARDEVNSRNTIPNGVLKYIIHSTETNNLLVNSVKAILHYLGRNILTDKPELLDSTVQTWKGSLLEHSLNIVLELLDTISNLGEKQNECSLACLNFIQDIVDGIFSSTSLNKHIIWRQQCRILMEFGNSKWLCIDFLDFLINKLQKMALKFNENKKKNDKNQDSDCNPDDVEKSFYLFYMIENLLKKLKTLNLFKQDSSCDDVMSEAETTSVVDLWRTNWCKTFSKTHEMPKQNIATKLVEWKDMFENVIIDCSQCYPFMSYYMWKCLELLNSSLNMNVSTAH